MVFHGIKNWKVERKNSLKDAPLGMKRYFNVSTASSAEEVFQLPAFPPSNGAKNSYLPCLRVPLCQGTGAQRWRTSASSWLWVWAQQQARVPPTLHFCTSFKKGFFFHSSEPTNLQHDQLRGEKKHLFCVKNHIFCVEKHPFWFPLDSFDALLRVFTGRGASGFVVLIWTSFSHPFWSGNHPDVLLHCQKSWECWC